MNILVCPICKGELKDRLGTNKGVTCKNKHSFDYAKEGYLNLHVGKNSKNSGDDKIMVNSRREFLEKGFYEEISLKVNEVLLANLGDEEAINKAHTRRLLDIGSGEGYYTNKMQECLKEFEINALDISKEAVMKGAKTYKKINWFVASASAQPFKNNSFDYLTVLFCKIFPDEFARIIKNQGFLVVVTPNKDHLVDIKKVVYPIIKYENSDPNDELKEKFTLISRENLFYKKMVYGDDIKNLFNMTPYRWKSPKEGVEKLNSLTELEVTVDVNIDIYSLNKVISKN